MFICSLGGVDHCNLRDMVYKYVWLLHRYAFMMKVMTDHEPNNYNEATQDPQWIEVKREEMRALVETILWI